MFGSWILRPFRCAGTLQIFLTRCPRPCSTLTRSNHTWVAKLWLFSSWRKFQKKVGKTDKLHRHASWSKRWRQWICLTHHIDDLGKNHLDVNVNCLGRVLPWSRVLVVKPENYAPLGVFDIFSKAVTELCNFGWFQFRWFCSVCRQLIDIWPEELGSLVLTWKHLRAKWLLNLNRCL